ncbi:hypothetical protein [Nocardioides antri]|uniref:hypothetical protein n=1 Tax=Nocardioides antri TaxID=2607659 RepID=UPI00165F35B2|nr:hypothetical protein [Nocardioides antri]
MSVMNASAAGQAGARTGSREPRVRELAREALALMAFSAGVSIAMALALLIAYGIGH